MSEAADAALVARLFAIAPRATGVHLRAPAGPERDAWLALVRDLLPAGTPVRRLPPGSDADRLLGGLDIALTLAHGRPAARPGLLAEADGGIVVAAMAERLPPATAGLLAMALDEGMAALERDGLGLRHPADFGLLALDEGEPEETAPAVLLERLAFRLDGVGAPAPATAADRRAVAEARRLLPAVDCPAACVASLCRAAAMLAIASLRPPLAALAAARAIAALDGRRQACERDAATAARLVLAPRALARPLEAAPGDRPASTAAPQGGDDGETAASAGEDLVLAAVRAAVPADLLARLAEPRTAPAGTAAGRSGALRRSTRRGRPVGAQRGRLRDGARLHLPATLLAAAPWQRLRPPPAGGTGLRIAAEDLRVRRFEERAETTTVFAVDASGSTALARLAEAKGAVERLLADCYVRRDRVALIAFRDRSADLLLPPTRSLTRARRALADLPGGGATPLAAGLAAARDLAEAICRRGGVPALVVLTDGGANVAADGRTDRAQAAADALAAARTLGREGYRALLIDPARRPRPEAERLATAMGAPYLPLPAADAAALSEAVRRYR